MQQNRIDNRDKYRTTADLSSVKEAVPGVEEIQENDAGKVYEPTGRKPDALRHEGLEANKASRFEQHYGCLVSKPFSTVEITAITPTGEKTIKADYCLWDTGATDCVLNKKIADKLGIIAEPIGNNDMLPMTMTNTNYIGTAIVRLKIGDIVTPLFKIKVTDIDPYGEFEKIGYRVPDMLIGMNLIASGRFELDSTGGETILTFEIY